MEQVIYTRMKEGKNLIKEFSDFLNERNVLDLAVGVIIGGAITTVIRSVVDNLFNPLIGLLVSGQALQSLNFKIASATFTYGNFLNDILNFLITAFIVFMILKFIRKTFKTKPKEEKFDESLQTLKDIRDILHRQEQDILESRKSKN